jgi:predicted TIM-barrel fold metal-dependent hydrolase
MSPKTTQPAPTEVELDYAICDADQHYYEPEDALTRHLDPALRRMVKWIDISGRRTLLLNDKLLTVVPNPTYDPVGVPGSMEMYFRAENVEGQELRDIMKMHPLQPEYRDREARVARLDEQGVQMTWLLPSLGLGIEELLSDEPESATKLFSAYNRWLEEDWGYDRDGRIMTGPLICMLDPEAAEKEVERALEVGTRMVVMRPAPVRSPGRHRSPADPAHDRVWARIAEAGLVVGIHAADSGYARYSQDWGDSQRYTGTKSTSMEEVMSVHIERPIFDMMAAMICHGLFDRHPTLKVATLELGAAWVPDLHRALRRAYGKLPQNFGQDPVEAFREHVWVAPFYEDDIRVLRDVHGADRILLGSDWPHPEGLATPRDWVPDFANLGAVDMRKALRDNQLALTGYAD